MRKMLPGDPIRLQMIIFILVLFHSPLPGQTPIAGVINVYTPVVAPGNCSNAVMVADAAQFAVGQSVLLISMQGGAMSADNDDDFGRVEAAELTAGQYDWSAIAAINGNEIVLATDISGRYDYQQAVQLVGIPTYADAVVTETIQPLPWDGTIGGVLALEVSGKLTLDADIDASGLGFRGGASVVATDINCTFLSSNSRYYYEAGNWRGAPKGEGVIPWLPEREYGRGPQANGGGGANNHNAGGGGGSQVSAGGQGGINDEPSFGGCDGFFPGLGGRPLPATADVLFMGGGGGAGHFNNDDSSDGGHGGGIVIIRAGELTQGGGRILADGLPGESVVGDGAGGGGAGGTIVLEVGSINGPIAISARGGDGGQADNSNLPRCMGPGGGGSGGRIISSIAVDADLAGGAAGLSVRSNVCQESTNEATAGEEGINQLGALKVSPPPPAAPAILSVSNDAVLCPGEAYQLIVITTGEELTYQWQAGANGQFVDLTEGAGYQGTRNDTLLLDSIQADATFRALVQHSCFGTLVSDTIALTLAAGAQPTAAFDYQLNGQEVMLENQSLNADVYKWTIEEIPSFQSQEVSPVYTFVGGGNFTVQLVAANSCGTDTVRTVITVGGAPTAAFSGERLDSECAPMTVQWMDASSGTFDTYQWFFPGGDPAMSQLPDPLVTYNTPGTYDVTLTVSGPFGESTITKPGIVTVYTSPSPAFDYVVDDLTVTFTNLSSDSEYFTWSFGDGTTSQEENPVHTFLEPGSYTVTLNAQNGPCGSATSQLILVFPTRTDEPVWAQNVVIAPNPGRGMIRILADDPRLYPMQVVLLTTDGRHLSHYGYDKGEAIPLTGLPAGLYFLSIQTPLGRIHRPLLKQD